MDIQTRPDPVARARELGAQVAAAADEIERTRRIPEALLGRLHDSRLFRMLLPRSAGGDETEPAVYVAAIEELARHDASIAWNAFVANSSALIAAYLEPAVNRAVFADPRSFVAWGPPNAARAQAVDGGYPLTGRGDFAGRRLQAPWLAAPRRRGARGGAARLGARLPDRDARNNPCAGRRRGADRNNRSGPRAARLHQRDLRRGRGGGLRLQGGGRRRDLPGRPVRAPLPRHAH